VRPAAALPRLRLAAGGSRRDRDRLRDASALGVRCFTLRSSTERTITLSHGTNTMLGDDPRDLADVRPSSTGPTPCAIPLWDGRAGERIAEALVANYALVRATGTL
jgi:UDP-N-acetylglucosamine 2-epimerase (non-hydrolysing)